MPISGVNTVLEKAADALKVLPYLAHSTAIGRDSRLSGMIALAQTSISS
jgi:hypothetical protein